MTGTGFQEYQRLHDSGQFTDQELEDWRSRRTDQLRGAKFSEQEIEQYWNGPPSDTMALDNLVKQNLARNADQPKVADDPWEMLNAGWDRSATGLLMHKPKTVAPEQTGFFNRIMYILGQFAGDLPEAVVGFFGGAAAGGAAGAATGPAAPVAAPIGAIAGAGFGSSAAPEAVRQVMMDHYQHGDFLSFSDFMARSAHMTYETAKQGTIGAVTQLIGGKVAATTLKATGSVGSAAVADLTTQAVAATGMQGALDGHIPDAQDFATALVLVGTMHVGSKLYTTVKGRIVPTKEGADVAKAMQETYARTGVPPWEQANRAKTDPVFQQALFGRDAGNNDPGWRAYKPDGPTEPPPYKTGETESPGVAEAFANAERVKKVVETPEDQIDLIDKLENSLGYAKAHGIDVNDVVSKAGAVGRYQITPDTARTYGFDPGRLREPAYNRMVAEHILKALSKRYRNADGSVDTEAVLIAYNAGPGRADVFRANGRRFNKLPIETQKYLDHADRLGAFDNQPPSPGGTGGGGEPPAGGVPRIKGPEPDPFELNKETLIEKINDVVANKVKPSIFERAKTALDRAGFEAVSELLPFERLDRTLGVKEDDYGIADSFRQIYGSIGRAWSMLHKGPVDPLTFEKRGDAAIIPAYKEAMKLGGGSLDEFRAVRQARRAIELAQTGRESFTNTKEAQALLDKVGNKYDHIIRTIRTANDAKIDYYRESGMISEAGAHDLKMKNKEWFPQIPDKEAREYAAKGGTRFGPRQVLKKAEGHGRQILDPITQEIQSYYSMAAVADKNRAVAGMFNALTPETMADLGIKLIEDGRPTPELFDKDGNLIPEAVDRTGPMQDKTGKVSYFKDGRRVTYQVDDPALAAAIRGVSPINPDQTLKVFRWFAGIKRAGITDMPDFIARAMMKDAVGSAILSKWGGLPFVNTLRGLYNMPMGKFKKGVPEVWERYVRSGAFGATLSNMDADYVARDLHNIEASTNTLGSVINTFKHPIEAAQILLQSMDNATRLGGFLRAEEAGLPSFKAGVESRKMTLDFAEKAAGVSANVMANLTPFYRPSVLGLKQTYQAFRDRPLETGAKAAIYIAAPTAILYGLNYMQDKYDTSIPEDQRYENLPRWQKDTMFILPRIGNVRMRLPMPPLLGTLVGGMTTRFLDWWSKDDPRAFEDWIATAIAQFVPPIVPAAILPVAENLMDRNFFTGKPLVPSSLEDASNYMQYTANTSPTAIALSKVLGPPGYNLVDVSPIVLENYARQWAGPMGVAVMKSVSAPFVTDKRPADIANNPFVGSFFVRNPGTTAEPITQFYDEMDKFTNAHKDLDLAIKRQDDSLINFTSSQVEAFVNLNQTRTALSTMRASIEGITNSDMTDDEKRQFIDQTVAGMIEMSKAGLEQMDAARKPQ